MILRGKEDGDSIEELAGFVEEHVNMALIYKRIEGQ